MRGNESGERRGVKARTAWEMRTLNYKSVVKLEVARRLGQK